MKKYYLSTPSERITGFSVSAVMIVAMAVLVFAVREDLAVMILTAVGCVLVAAGLIYYSLNVVKAAVEPVPGEKKLLVHGIRSYTLDLTNAVRLETITVKSGQVTGRALHFSDAEGKTVGVVPTMFTSNNGLQAEPMAIELAKDLGLEFYANVPKWEYDEEARKAHEIEVAQQQKEEAKARREAKQKAKEAKIRQKMDEIRKEKQK
ncbi:MAG: hypothetical protein IKC09_00900 [Oscillospiraceae bacterium]|nr:hypothetical protein [Oscillospiraceae bacterium]